VADGAKCPATANNAFGLAKCGQSQRQFIHGWFYANTDDDSDRHRVGIGTSSPFAGSLIVASGMWH